MTESFKLPVGIESFEEIRSDGYYYVDKTKLIEQLVDSRGKVNLFTRPRRFGKTLNMSMLKSFFEIGAASELFDGLYISHNKKLCDDNMGKYPVIFLSLKNVEGLDFQAAKYQMIEIIAKEAKRFAYLKQSDRLDIDDKSAYASLIRLEDGRYEMRDEALYASLQTLSELLYKHHCRKTVILIDEYDVPLDKAFQNGYYKEMVSLIRAIFGKALKTNEALDFAVLTGCLRVSKESIFTGLNNFKVLSIADVRFDEQFGFKDEEVRKLLKDYDLEDYFSEAKEWYDGYHFGNADIYCPWDVINYVEHLQYDPEAEPEAFWINSSGNDLVKRFVAKADQTTKDEIEIKGSVSIDAICFEMYTCQAANECEITDYDEKEYLALPGIAGYISDGTQNMWNITKKYHTTMDMIKQQNSQLSDIDDLNYRPPRGQKLLLIKTPAI